MRPSVRAGLVVLAALGAAAGLPGCSSVPGVVPRCDSMRRVAIVAQAVPEAAYVPCIEDLADEWEDTNFVAARGRVSFRLHPPRGSERTVRVALEETCDVGGAVPTAARAAGVRTSVRLRSITPRYAGTLFDVFAGGCVSYEFDFSRGPHIGLMEELRQAVGLLPRQQLRLEVERELDVELGS